MKIFIDCMKSKSVHSIYYKFIYLLSKLVIAKELCSSDYLKLKLNSSSSLTGSNDIGKSNEVHYADDNKKLSNGNSSNSSSNFNNKDYLIKIKTLKDSTIHILNNKINELTDEVNFKESLQIKIINSSLSFFENNEYLTAIPNLNKVENDNNDNYIVDDDHDYASQNKNDLQNYHKYNNVNNNNNNNNNKEQNQNLSVMSKVFQQNQSNHLHTNEYHHHDNDLKLETNRLIRRASMSFLKQRGSSKLSTLHEIQIIKDNNFQKLENFKLKLQQIIENFEQNVYNKTTVSSSSSSSVNAADSSTSPKTTTSSLSSSSPSLDTKKNNSFNTLTIKSITNKSIDKLKLTLNISKSLSSDRKMHLTILKQHGEELLYNFHEELEIKMKNCFILCKNAIILRSDTLDSIESKMHIFLYK